MYALSSKDQLSKRQSRWVQDITDASRSVPTTDSLPRSAIINPAKELRDDSKILEKIEDLSMEIKTISEKMKLIIQKLDLKPKTDKNYFIPYFVDENHVGKNNYTRLTENRLVMDVEIIGNFTGIPTIYPFGSEKEMDNYKPCNISLCVKQTGKIITGSFKKNSEGIYVITLGPITHELPVTLSCSFDLIY